MDNKIKGLVSCFLLICSLGNAQNTKKAERNFDDYSYVDAIASYENLVKKGYSNEEILEKLGDAHYNNAEYKEAGAWYEKLFALENSDPKPEYRYRYAMSLKSMGEYEKADRWMQKFEEVRPSDIRALKFDENRDYRDKIEEYSHRYSIKNLSLNSKESDFAPSVYKGMLVFSSARDSGLLSRNVHLWNNEPFQKLYRASISEEEPFTDLSGFSGELDTKAHETSTAFSKDGNTLYFTRNNFKNGNFTRDDEGISRLKLYRAVMENGKWKQVTELPFNGDGYSVAHPSLSADGKRLYFASDMPGSIGSSDIFFVDLHSDGTFGEPKNLGAGINTEGRETFPYVTASDLLYFASDGQLGLGGLDIFATQLGDAKNNCVVNIGEPINSKADDFALVLDGTGRKGFFSSNREGGMGSDDIYGFTEEKLLKIKCIEIIEGIVRNEEDGHALAKSEIKVFDRNNKIVAEGITDNTGTFRLEPTYRSGDYKIKVNKEGYVGYTAPVIMSKDRDVDKMELALKRNIAPEGTDLASYLKISPVYFESDESEITEDMKVNLDKIATYMKTYRTLKIEVEAHTDAKGSDSYNASLSERRALATVEYLVSKGIDVSRISGKGYGEKQLTNNCETWEKCSDGQNRLNRRSEFIVVK